MAHELIIAEEAEQDVDQAFAWYESQRKGLGEDFLSRLDACLAAIARTPHMHRIVAGNCRRALVRRFPYAVFYETIGDDVNVYCVFHTSQNPAKWKKRLPK